uniref:Predicted protein n=1 Tax=Hordeum vulgare subsp. vulgare TaxID=112509 RepID=F2D606_HORVV|nr:predicted protein [Hordeum vulgare subsp. vulgare]
MATVPPSPLPLVAACLGPPGKSPSGSGSDRASGALEQLGCERGLVRRRRRGAPPHTLFVLLGRWWFSWRIP